MNNSLRQLLAALLTAFLTMGTWTPTLQAAVDNEGSGSNNVTTEGTAGNGALGQGTNPSGTEGGAPEAVSPGGAGQSTPDSAGLSDGTGSDSAEGSASSVSSTPDRGQGSDIFNFFYHQLTAEERAYFLLRQDEGDFEMIVLGEHTGTFNFTGYRESTSQLLDNVIAEAQAGSVDHLRLALFVVFLNGDTNQPTPSITFFEPDGDGGTVTHPEFVTLNGNTLTVDGYIFGLSGEKVVSAQAPGQMPVNLAPADQFLLPPTIDRVFPTARSDRM